MTCITDRRFRHASPFLIVVAALAVACGDGGPTDPSPQVATLEVTPAADTLTALGDTVQLAAVARDADGEVVADAEILWSTSDATVATVTDGGLVRAVANGGVEVRASTAGVTGTAVLAVLQQVSAVSVTPATATLVAAGSEQQFTATATDAGGSEVAGAEFVWTSENHEVATVDRNGVATAHGSGAVTITAAARGVPGHADLTVQQAVEQLVFRTEPGTARAGEAFDPAVQVALLDAGGTVVQQADDAVTLTIGTNPVGGTLGGTATVHAVNGVATFTNVWLDRAASGYTLSAGTAAPATGATSAAFEITAGPAAKLGFSTQPSDAVAGEAMAPAVVVEIRDAYGNPVAADAQISMALAANPGNTALSGTLSVETTTGVAAFPDLALDRAATGYTLAATAPELAGATSASFGISAAAPARLAFVGSMPEAEAQQPPGTAIRVAVQDRFGNPTSTAGHEVRLSLVGNPTGGRLGGTLSEQTVAGEAAFGGVTVDRPGLYTLGAAATGLTPAESPPFPITLTTASIAAGHLFTCAVSTVGAAFCWGEGDVGQLGTGQVAPSATPAAVLDGTVDAWQSIGTGFFHGCAVVADGQAGKCWGDNRSGQLGIGGTENQLTPRWVATGSWAVISPGAYYTCGIDTGGSAYCWGSDGYGALGTGTTGSHTPAAVADPPSGPVTWIDISASVASHTCGISSTGDAYCWGRNGNGQLGDGTTTNRSTPVPVSDPAAGPVSWSAISTGSSYTCGVTTTGAGYCWGSNFRGKLGDGTTTDSSTPVPVADPADGAVSWSAISTGGSHSCGVSAAGDIYCWGYGGGGSLGNGTLTDFALPTPIADPAAGSVTWSQVDAGTAHTCGVTIAGASYCWGSNSAGQLGDGTTTDRQLPTAVVQ